MSPSPSQRLHHCLARAHSAGREAAQLRALHADWALRGALAYTLNALQHDAQALQQQCTHAQQQASACLQQLFTCDINGALQ